MTKLLMILVVLLLCVWAGGGFAAPASVFYFGFPIQVSLTNGTFFWIIVPSVPITPTHFPIHAGTIPGGGEQGEPGEPLEPEDPDDPDYQPSPVQPDLEGDLSGLDDDIPPPP